MSVLTGIGVVAPTGIGHGEHWLAVLGGRSGIRPIDRFDTTGYPLRVAGQVAGFEPARHLSNKLAVQTDRWTQLALAATGLALRDAGVDPTTGPYDEYDMAVVTAASSGGNEFGQGELGNLWSRGPSAVTPFQSIAWFYAASTGQISISNTMRGPCGVIVSDGAGGLDAIGQARRLIRSGTPMAVTGGTEAPLSPYAVVCQHVTGELAPDSDPGQAYLPFTAAAHGHVPGEGGAILVLEDEGSARRRGADAYARIAGYAATFDPAPGTGRPGNLAAAVRGALDDAGLHPGEIDVVVADAAGTPVGDAEEVEAIVSVFGERRVPVTAPKVLTGRLSSGAGSLDVATAALMMRAGTIPATPSGDHATTDRIDLVRDRPRDHSVTSALVIARGHGGFNSAVALAAV